MSDQSTQSVEPLLGEDVEQLRERWQSIQAAFVDEPQEAVQQADALVTDVIKRLTRTFEETKDSLETQLAEAEDVSTEDLRIGLQRYRTFFERLLAA
jgi:molecular chaperone GrpE (heat shock protein)